MIDNVLNEILESYNQVIINEIEITVYNFTQDHKHYQRSERLLDDLRVILFELKYQKEKENE
jgi:hypothetical protein